jgi:ATP/maltotriose-dependent transcriptional regulator MalT
VHGSWQLERALVWGREAEAVMRAAGSASGRVTALFYLGNAARIVGAYAEAEQALRECERLALKLGNALLRQYSQLILSLVLIRRGRSAEADELLCALRASPDANIEHGARAIAAEARLGERDFEAALAAALDAVDGPASPYRRMAHSTLARTYLALQRPDAALASAEQALGEGAAANPEFEADLLATQAQALLALERSEEARAVLAKARAFVRGVAEGIGDAELRRAFLGELEGNVRVLALAREQAVGDL